MSNDLRFNYSRNRVATLFIVDSFGGGTPPPDSLMFLPFATRQNTVSRVGVGPNFFSVGGDNNVNLQRQVNLVDNLIMVSGSHQIKFGVDYRRLSPVRDRENYGTFIFFFDPNAAVANRPTFVQVETHASQHLLFTNFSAYGQDAWKVTPRFTLNYGLRWEVNPAPSETTGHDALTVTGLDNLRTMTIAPRGTPLWETTYDNFAPRIGIAYQLSQARGQETVLRGGFGIFYDLGSGPVGSGYADNSFGNTGAKALPNSLPIDPAQATPPSFSRNPPYGSLVVYQPNFKLPRTYQWNVALERSLGSRQTVTASYVAAIGRHLLRPEEVTGTALPNTNFTRLIVVRNAATSDYHALQLQFQRRLSHGLQALASYTWAHSIDIASAETTTTGGKAVPITQIDPKIDRGPSNFDVRHAFVTALTYEVPKTNMNRFASTLLRDWATDSIFRARTAPPIDLFAGFQPVFGTNVAARPDLILGVPLYVKDSTVPGGWRINRAAFAVPPPGRQGTLGRNRVHAFPLSQLDFSLRRKFELGERFNLQFRGDLFNALNHPNFGHPSNFLGDPLFGQARKMLRCDLGCGDGGFSPLYQIGGPRSIQLALRLQF